MRPHVWLNCAVSQDGFLAGPDRKPVLLSCPEDLQRVHAMRAAADAILVGVGTVIADDPSLRVKQALARGPDPVRVILDTDGRIPMTARVLGEDTIIYIGRQARAHGPGHWVVVPEGPQDLAWVLEDLHRRGIRSVMVEGGAEVLASFVASGLWDEATVYVAPVTLGDGPRLVDVPGFVRDDPLGDGTLRRFIR